MSSSRPDSATAVEEIVRAALAQQTPLIIVGGNSKFCLGRRVPGLTPLDVSGLAGVVTYEPAELILVAKPGTRLSDAEEMLAREGQRFAFEPPSWGNAATLGGTISCNLSGPRRYRAGAVRDHLLGIEMVNGFGERIRAGGRVVKNVTGYDLPRVLAGSFGTLGALTEVCLKVLPLPDYESTLRMPDLNPAEALEVALSWAGLPMEITGLAFAPEVGLMARIEGPKRAVTTQVDSLKELCGFETALLEEESSVEFWRQWKELEWLKPLEHEQRWRFSGPPTRVVRLMEALRAHGLKRWGFDWAGGLLWALFNTDAEIGVIHRTAVRHEAIAWRLASPGDERNEEAFTPPSGAVVRMNQILKHALDPQAIFNPGRIYALDETQSM